MTDKLTPNNDVDVCQVSVQPIQNRKLLSENFYSTKDFVIDYIQKVTRESGHSISKYKNSNIHKRLFLAWS